MVKISGMSSLVGSHNPKCTQHLQHLQCVGWALCLVRFSKLVVVGLHNLLELCHGEPILELQEVLVPLFVVG